MEERKIVEKMEKTKRMTKRELELEVERLREALQRIVDTGLKDIKGERVGDEFVHLVGKLQGIASFALSDLASRAYLFLNK